MDDLLDKSKMLKIMDTKIECVEFAPDIFAHLRGLDNITNDELKKSMNPFTKVNGEAIRKSGEGMGKSGSFFFFSGDKKLLIKTMTTGDFNAFMKVFRKYFEHLNVYKTSLLARIYGVYQVTMGELEPVYLVLMGNSKICEDEHVKYLFDLKGSMVKREEKGVKKNTHPLKDKNILQLKEKMDLLNFKKDDITKIV